MPLTVPIGAIESENFGRGRALASERVICSGGMMISNCMVSVRSWKRVQVRGNIVEFR